jgi:hypothetical protein
VIRWRARRSHLLDLQCGAESALPPATSDRRAIRSPNISPRLRPSQIRGANISAPPISPFKADNKSPAEIPIATASPHYPLPQSPGYQSTNPVLILQQGDDRRDATVPNASPSLVSADMGFPPTVRVALLLLPFSPPQDSRPHSSTMAKDLII